MTPYAHMLLAYIRPESQGAYAYEYRQYAKDPMVALVLTLVLGVIGGESYYMGNYKRGFLMTLALFTGVGLFVTVPMWIARCFTITGECETYDDYLAYMLASRYANEASATPEPPQVPSPNGSGQSNVRPTIGGLPMRPHNA